ncbi:1084_t:CDS:2 [Ambispora leptoticha]|uniref:Aldoketomutase n=1 Tax=Ambispora leptoticha TaxID=144679 RepID=A0A9N9AVP6_9GLOM|nr:1084_t:CDS:2 [Ambispora leptoticha]
MIRVKDPVASLQFYQDVLGMKLINRADYESGKFTLYFLAYVPEGELPEAEQARKAYTFNREAVLELTHNWGTEHDENFHYSSGNKDPGRGFGHLAITVDNIEAACARFEEKEVTFIKRLQDGTMNNIAFIADPDGYWIEIVPKGLSSV